MIEQLTNPQWHAFQESLARGAGLSILVLGPDGRVQAAHDPWGELPVHTGDREAGGGLRRLLPEPPITPGPGRETILVGPSGAPAVLVPLGGGEAAVLISAANGITRGRRGPDADPGGEGGLSPVSRLHSIARLYSAMSRAATATSPAGRRRAALIGSGTLGRLACELAERDPRELGLVLDLAAGSTAILLGAAAAWGFSWAGRTSRATAVSATGGAILRPLEDYWRTARVSRDEAVAGLPGRIGLVGGGRRVLHFEASSSLCAVSLGVLEPAADAGADRVLGVLAARVIVAAEIAAVRGLLERRLGALLDGSSRAVLAVGPDGRVAMINRAAKALFDSLGIALAVGESSLGAGLGEDVEQAIRGALAGRREERQLDLLPDRFVSWTASPLESDDGRASGCVLVIRDVTDSAVCRARTQDLEKLTIIGHMAAGMAHEIRSPLTAANGILQLLQARPAPQDEGGLLRRLQSELERMNNVLGNYLSLSHPSGPDAAGAIDVRVPVREALRLVGSTATARGVELIADIPEGPFPCCSGRPEAVRQVLLCLAENALEAMDREGRLEIGLAASGPEVLIFVEDTGPGIPDEVRDHLFRPFFTTKPHRTGLGLSVARELVRQMRGTVEVHNRGHRGARALVRLPAVRRPEGATA